MAQSPCCNADIFYIGATLAGEYTFQCMNCTCTFSDWTALHFADCRMEFSHFDGAQFIALKAEVDAEAQRRQYMPVKYSMSLGGTNGTSTPPNPPSAPSALPPVHPNPIYVSNIPFGGGGIITNQTPNVQSKPIKTKCVLCFAPVELPWEKAEMALKESFHMPCCGGGFRDGGQLIEKQRARLKGEMAR